MVRSTRLKLPEVNQRSCWQRAILISCVYTVRAHFIEKGTQVFIFYRENTNGQGQYSDTRRNAGILDFP